MNALKIFRTDSDHPDFRALIVLLDEYLRICDGDEHAFYASYNKVDLIKHVVVVYSGDKAVGCGAIKKFSDSEMEVKRMFVRPEARGQGIAGIVLQELEKWALELGFSACVLETGKRQVEAIRLYQKSAYQLTPNYGQYIGKDNSVCMKKLLR